MTGNPASTSLRLLIADDDSVYRDWLRLHLGVLYPDATVAVLDLEELAARAATLVRQDCDVLLLVARFGSNPEDPWAAGLELLRKLRGRPGLPAIVAVAHEGNELTAVRAVQLGAVDYIPRRLLTPELMRASVELGLKRLERRDARAAVAAAQDEDDEHLDEDPPASKTSRSTEEQALEPSVTVTVDLVIASLTSSPVPAQVIPGYTIRAKIRESDAATVYLAASEALFGDSVALKVTRASHDQGTGLELLEREYTPLASIRSPAVATIYDYGMHGGFEYLAMEYLPRGDLKARMLLGLTEQEALHYTQRVAHALQVIHEAGVLHRDLKPPNVLLRENDDVALIDFGPVRDLDEGASAAASGVVRGSPYYMSPEHALGEELDARSDFYSLGIMLYEMLTGKKPYTGSTPLELLQQHVSAPLPRLPLGLDRYQPLLTRLLAKSRYERFVTAAEIIAALQQLPPLEAQPATQSTAA